METLYNFYAPSTPMFAPIPVSTSTNYSQIIYILTTKIWMLGKQFDPEIVESTDTGDTPTGTATGNTNNTFTFNQFLYEFSQKTWFSYRRDFLPIEDTPDAGWGCMLRSGQMMLAQAFVNHRLGRNWTLPRGGTIPLEIYEIVRLFGDSPTTGHPFSIHEIARVGQKYGKSIGDWFAPSTIALSLAELVSLQRPEGLKLIVSDDGALYLDKVMALCAPPPLPTSHSSSAGPSSSLWKELVILIPLRLGLDNMNPVYYTPILELFKFPQSLGIVGGKPRASLYFIAAQGEYVFYLDPHVVQPALNTDEQFSLDSYHTTCSRKMHISEVDPSLALAFQCKDKADFDDFCERMHLLSEKYKDAVLFTVAEQSPDYQRSKSTRDGADEDDDEVEMDMDMVVL